MKLQTEAVIIPILVLGLIAAALYFTWDYQPMNQYNQLKQELILQDLRIEALEKGTHD